MTPTFVALFVFVASWSGVAFQSLAMVLLAVGLAIWFRSAPFSSLLADYRRSLFPRLALLLGIGWLVLALVSSVMNPWTAAAWPSFIPAYIWWALGPFTVATLASAIVRLDRFKALAFRNTFFRYLWLVIAIACLIAASQYLFGWKIHGTEFIRSERRARLLFSHPLSLAYILLLYFPLVGALVVRNPRSRQAWAVAGALLFLVFVSSSRTVQAVLALLTGVFVLFGLGGRIRIIGIAVGLAFAVILVGTDNPVRQRFVGTIEQTEDREQYRYADDRIAFWAVHWDMFKERPLFGHGLSYRQDYLDRYYVAHGFPDFKKKYPAHNMYLQVMVNTGIAGLLVWLSRLAIDVMACFAVIRGAAKRGSDHKLSSKNSWVGWVGIATIAGMLLAGLTQNAFQDSAVRFHWTILEGLLLWFTSRQVVADGRDPVTKPV